jgi:hypothetical protein
MRHAKELTTAIFLMVGLAYSTATSAKTERKSAEVLAFKRHSLCPSTGERGGKCPGYVIDHIHPLCAGGADNHKTNMQWQTVEDAKAKDVIERRMCRNQKRQG